MGFLLCQNKFTPPGRTQDPQVLNPHQLSGFFLTPSCPNPQITHSQPLPCPGDQAGVSSQYGACLAGRGSSLCRGPKARRSCCLFQDGETEATVARARVATEGGEEGTVFEAPGGQHRGVMWLIDCGEPVALSVHL